MAVSSHTGFNSGQLLWSAVRERPLRTLVTILGIAIEVFLLLMIVGLTTGVIAEWARRVEGVGADILVRAPNSSIFFAFSSPILQESLTEQIGALPGVDEVAPVLVAADTRSFDLIYGIDYRRFNELSKGFYFYSGGPFAVPEDVIVDDIKARSRNLHVGDQIELLGREFRICGIVASGKGARYFIPLATAQEILGAGNHVSMFYVRSKGDTDGTRQALVKLLPDYRILSMAEYLTLMNSSNLPELKPFLRAMVGLGVGIGFLIVLLTMYTMVLERTREIGILKALGTSKLGILWLVLKQTLLLASLGSLFGLGITFGLRAILQRSTPTLTIQITPQWVVYAVAWALGGALVGALYPAFRAAQFDPVDALAYE